MTPETDLSEEDAKAPYSEWFATVRPYKGRRSRSLFSAYYRRNYLPHLADARDDCIVELGCGSGEFLAFLREQGFANVRAIDLDAEHARQSGQYGYPVEQADVFDFVPTLEDHSVEVFVMNDLIEHIPRERVTGLMELIHNKLSTDGRFLVKTCNCNSPYGVSTFFSDFTHVEGYTPQKLGHLAALTGFTDCKAYNVFICPGLPVVDDLYTVPFRIGYRIKGLGFRINGKAADGVFSKNFLAVLKP
jgi:SAM-dependent methyltransferase